MSASEPGTVAVATVRGVPNVRVMRYKEGASGDWFSDSQIHGAYYSHLDSDVTDVRPLVVLDLTSSAFALEVIRTLREYGKRNGGDTYMYMLADQIEAQTKPPRIPEPKWGAIVEAGVKQHDVRLRWTPTATGYWACENDAEYDRGWSDLVDPVLIREGVAS